MASQTGSADHSIPLGEIRVTPYRPGAEAVTIRVVDGELPLVLGARFEVEVVAIERRVTERLK